MKNIKDYKAFLESYSEDVKSFIEDDKKFALLRGGELIFGFDEIQDAFLHLSDMLVNEKQITLDEKDEFDSIVEEKILDNIVDQFLIDNILEDLLDRFSIIEPFNIKQKSELEETPIDSSLDNVSEVEELTSILSESKKSK